MKIEDILEKKIPEAIKYASNIIFVAKNFVEFAVALTDYMGKDFIPYCKSVYMILKGFPHSSNILFATDEELASFTPAIIEAEYTAFIAQQKKEIKRTRI